MYDSIFKLKSAFKTTFHCFDDKLWNCVGFWATLTDQRSFIVNNYITQQQFNFYNQNTTSRLIKNHFALSDNWLKLNTNYCSFLFLFSTQPNITKLKTVYQQLTKEFARSKVSSSIPVLLIHYRNEGPRLISAAIHYVTDF